MEPDILASASEPRIKNGAWPDKAAVHSEGPPKVETPSDTLHPRFARMHAVTVHAPVVPRVRPHGGGYANGHARPRLTAPTSWRAPVDDSAAPRVLPFET